MISPPYLEAGDEVRILSTARKIDPKSVDEAANIIKGWGLQVSYGKNLFSSDHQYAGTDEERLFDMQEALDDENVKAIFCARGGYGTLRIIDELDFSKFRRLPKWVVGYSDITFLHAHVQRNFEMESLHASMPINFPNNTPASLDNLKDMLFGDMPKYEFSGHNFNREGSGIGEIVGGNLSILYALKSTSSMVETGEKILFIEDLDEYLYHVDRMMLSLKRAGVFKNLKGLIIGGMTDMNDNEIPFGRTAEEIIRDCVSEYSYPVAFGFPAGHIDNNNPIILGRWAELTVAGDACSLSFSS